MQQNFSATGWHNWSSQCLKNLKQAADEGKRIVYIAGGSDLYQLITRGIYNITVIDPQLPSQPKYYTNEWAWIMKGAGQDGGRGDQIVFEEQKITMTRVGYLEVQKPFKARLEDGQVISINPSKTTWMITDKEGKQLGTYILERRFVEQNDFKTTDDRALLISFNELFFIALPDALNGWRIEPSKFDDNFTMFVKHLHEPVAKAEVCNIRTAAMLNASDFKFICLGSCIN